MADTGLLALAGMRIGVGALAWARPELAAKVFRLPRPTGEASYLWRLFGIRDVAIGVGTMASSGTGQQWWARAGLVCDVADGAAAAISARRGELPRNGAASMIVVPAAAVAYGLWALNRPNSTR